jgi:hypothetical protein
MKVSAGLLLGAAGAFLALRGVDLDQVAEALGRANLLDLAAAAALMLFSHFLRARRWGLLLAPARKTDSGGLFAALMIGYAANTFVPAHLGEFLRAAVVSRRRGIPAAAAFASIVVERIVDVVSLIAVMGLVVAVHPFPAWVVSSGYMMLAGACGLLAALSLGRRFAPQAAGLLNWLLRPLPGRIAAGIERAASAFLNGIAPLESAAHYALAAGLSIAIWLCYAGVYYICLEAFGLAHLPWYAGLVVLVFTTVSVVIPSTPGYVGTFHYLCQMALVMFGVAEAEALSYAVASHLVGVLPATLTGLAFAHREGIAIFKAARESRRALS